MRQPRSSESWSGCSAGCTTSRQRPRCACCSGGRLADRWRDMSSVLGAVHGLPHGLACSSRWLQQSHGLHMAARPSAAAAAALCSACPLTQPCHPPAWARPPAAGRGRGAGAVAPGDSGPWAREEGRGEGAGSRRGRVWGAHGPGGCCAVRCCAVRCCAGGLCCGSADRGMGLQAGAALTASLSVNKPLLCSRRRCGARCTRQRSSWH